MVSLAGGKTVWTQVFSLYMESKLPFSAIFYSCLLLPLMACSYAIGSPKAPSHYCKRVRASFSLVVLHWMRLTVVNLLCTVFVIRFAFLVMRVRAPQLAAAIIFLLVTFRKSGLALTNNVHSPMLDCSFNAVIQQWLFKFDAGDPNDVLPLHYGGHMFPNKVGTSFPYSSVILAHDAKFSKR